MAQYVQTTLDYKAELNLIEGVGHQEGKIREHTQVEAGYGYECTASGTLSCTVGGGGGQSPLTQGTITITSQDGPVEFKIVSGCLRIPLAGAYMAIITIQGGNIYSTMTSYVKVDGETIYQVSTTGDSSQNKKTVEKILNLGRYSKVEHRGSLYYAGGGAGVTSSSNLTITLKRI